MVYYIKRKAKMKIFKRRKKDEKPLLLTGYVEKTERIDEREYAPSKNEERAELLYGHKTESTKKKIEPICYEYDFRNEFGESENLDNGHSLDTLEKRIKIAAKHLPERYGKRPTLRERAGKFLSEQTYKTADKYLEQGYNETAQVGARLLGGIDADENLKMSTKDRYLSTPFALENKKYNSISEVSPFLRPFVLDKVKRQLGTEYVSTIKGLFIDNDKDASERLSKNKDIHLYVRENKEFLKNFGFIKKGSIQFTDSNFYNAIGKADIVDMYLNPNGEITFYVIDTYDFNKNSNNPFVRAGRKNQESGNLIPYFIIYSVKIDKYTSERILR